MDTVTPIPLTKYYRKIEVKLHFIILIFKIFKVITNNKCSKPPNEYKINYEITYPQINIILKEAKLFLNYQCNINPPKEIELLFFLLRS